MVIMYSKKTERGLGMDLGVAPAQGRQGTCWRDKGGPRGRVRGARRRQTGVREVCSNR